MDVRKWWPYVGCLAIGAIAGALVASQLSCSNSLSTEHTTNAPRVALPSRPDSVYLPGKPYAVHDGVGSVRVDTVRITSTVPTATPCPDVAALPSQPTPFSLPAILERAAPTVIAAFEPRNPVQLLEVYLHGGHNFIGGGYSAGGEVDLNLGQIHFAPVTLFGDIGYDQGFHLTAGVRGKIWGAI